MTWPGLAICRVLYTSPRYKYTNHSLTNEKEEQGHLVVFSFTTTPPWTNTLHMRNSEDFAEGREVYVWEPWQEAVLSSSTPANDDWLAVESTGLLNMTAAPFPLPSSFPLPLSLTRVKEKGIPDVPFADTALLCSRFLIMG